MVYYNLPKFSSRCEKRLLALCKNNPDQCEDIRKWNRIAVEYLVKRLRKNLDSIDDLEKAISQECANSRCVKIPASLDNRLLVSHRRAPPHVVYCRLWRWPDLQSQHQIRPTQNCEGYPEYCSQAESQVVTSSSTNNTTGTQASHKSIKYRFGSVGPNECASGDIGLTSGGYASTSSHFRRSTHEVCINPYHYEKKKSQSLEPLGGHIDDDLPQDVSTSFEDSDPSDGLCLMPDLLGQPSVLQPHNRVEYSQSSYQQQQQNQQQQQQQDVNLHQQQQHHHLQQQHSVGQVHQTMRTQPSMHTGPHLQQHQQQQPQPQQQGQAQQQVHQQPQSGIQLSSSSFTQQPAQIRPHSSTASYGTAYSQHQQGQHQQQRQRGPYVQAQHPQTQQQVQPHQFHQSHSQSNAVRGSSQHLGHRHSMDTGLRHNVSTAGNVNPVVTQPYQFKQNRFAHLAKSRHNPAVANNNPGGIVVGGGLEQQNYNTTGYTSFSTYDNQEQDKQVYTQPYQAHIQQHPQQLAQQPAQQQQQQQQQPQPPQQVQTQHQQQQQIQQQPLQIKQETNTVAVDPYIVPDPYGQQQIMTYEETTIYDQLDDCTDIQQQLQADQIQYEFCDSQIAMPDSQTQDGGTYYQSVDAAGQQMTDLSIQPAAPDIDFQDIQYVDGPNWCSVTYHEYSIRVGEKYSSISYTFSVDGYTNPLSTDRFCIGGLSNVLREESTEWVRRRIGRGIEFSYIDNEVHAKCLCEDGIFVSSSYLALITGKAEDESVQKVPFDHSIKVFSNTEFSKMLACAAMRGFEAVYKLTTSCRIRCSLVKGWGRQYKRRTVMDTPAWLEIQLNAPLQWIDQVLRQMQPPQGCGSSS